ncbi:efflux RND transporter periplasmic adaptor subunit [Novosphingobium sp. KCTC 2891]|uniref:efflux RND transporter periplasmic adaptor subunit n=1 Tax=Novosphingobium sp. KCTC 2891 TaxID=2989730 RepID=UPI0022222EB0|nr:efflux RND transporter periplasmic adaptor subunit [Novosphingobium sp. KCTC 2891]MCW1383764.1 efflux RND transporter periplasmic adaptor subunit [Novosphingobium sp. KCTC 2891]
MVLTSPKCALILLSLAVGGCARSDPDPRTQPPLVRTVVVSQSGASEREFTGVVAARVQSDLGFRVGGKVVERLVQAGQAVRRGQPLMRIDPADLALASQAARGALEAARARAIQTAADERRYRDMVAAGAVSASAYDQAKAAADAARAQLSAAQAEARVASNGSSYALLVADADGTVVETMAEPGQVVGAGQIVVRIARSGPREALVQLPETVRPRIGSSALASTFAGATGTAQLRLLSDAADPASRTFEARYVLSGAAASAPLGSTITIALSQPGAAGATVVPLGAVRDTGNGPGVWLIRAGSPAKVDWRPVRISAIGEDTATIASGLKPGERFVALGAHMLHQGEAVRIERTATGAVR